ncbi:ATP-binding protein [Pacificimonas flava]|uniref:ATP-binding protein n=2 Tax=Pacificimonas TaxID=1960290 RepID=A0A219B4F2_9SPHN|nr:MULTISPECIES: terminase family protein [Pacificimonas]MBZ6377022.1 DNA-packaging protein [Pacificimonas aurantium]OWV33235.1 ATP-binding protein [Pacificimonas flava]
MTARGDASLLARIAQLPEPYRRTLLERLDDDDIDMLATDWEFRARAGQTWPELVSGKRGSTWLMLAGRGYGKTRAGAEWVRTIAETVPGARIALIGATLDEARRVLVEGTSGLLNIGEESLRPRYYPARRLLKWPATGACAILYSGESPDGLRGPEHHAAWGDELAKWLHPDDTLANLRMGLRLGRHPRLLLTTTPRPIRAIKELLSDPDVTVSRGATGENTALPSSFRHAMARRYGGTRLGRQELDGELIEDLEGALWSRPKLESLRISAAPEDLKRVVVAVDPPAGGTGAGAAECGIVVAGIDDAECAYVLADRSVAGPPHVWAAQVAAAYDAYDADRVVAEINQGGDMVEATLRAAEAGLPVLRVRATRGKVARAEPVAALYERDRVRHVGPLPELEDQLCGLILGGGYEGPGRSPDRADALVWALTELMLGPAKGRPQIRSV